MTALKLTKTEQGLLAALPDGALAQALQTKGLPNRRVEGWRWSDLRAALRDEKPLTKTFDGALPAEVLPVSEATTLIFANGVLQAYGELPEGVTLEQGVSEMAQGNNLPAGLAQSLAAKKIILHITKPVKEKIRLRFIANGSGAINTHLQITLSQGASAHFLETHENENDPFINGAISFDLAAASHLTRSIFQPQAAKTIMVQNAFVKMAERAHYNQTLIGFGGAYTRFETQIETMGDEIRINLATAYLLSGKSHFDSTSKIIHNGLNGTTEQLTKGIVRDQARAVFQGKFYVARGAQKTAANMQHKALMLSDTSEVDAKPELEIYADDVECAHGNSVGALDLALIFYMRQRGLSEEQARAMLIAAFLSEVLEQITDETLRGQFTDKVAGFMEGRT
jgi:Fe-S cluster assembly protein SufD